MDYEKIKKGEGGNDESGGVIMKPEKILFCHGLSHTTHTQMSDV